MARMSEMASSLRRVIRMWWRCLAAAIKAIMADRRRKVVKCMSNGKYP